MTTNFRSTEEHDNSLQDLALIVTACEWGEKAQRE